MAIFDGVHEHLKEFPTKKLNNEKQEQLKIETENKEISLFGKSKLDIKRLNNTELEEES